MRNRRWALALVVLAATSSCRRGGGEEPTSSQIVNEEAELTMTIKVRGDVTLDFDGKTTAKYTAIRSTDSANSVEVLGVRPSDALKYRDALFVPGMTVLPFRGDGTYVVPKVVEGSQTPPPGAGSATDARSTVSLYWYADGVLEHDPIEFNRHLQDCIIRIEKHGTRGQAKCPKVANAKGDKAVSIEYKWTAPRFKVHDRVTTPDEPSDPSSTSSTSP